MYQTMNKFWNQNQKQPGELLIEFLQKGAEEMLLQEDLLPSI